MQEKKPIGNEGIFEKDLCDIGMDFIDSLFQANEIHGELSKCFLNQKGERVIWIRRRILELQSVFDNVDLTDDYSVAQALKHYTALLNV